MKSDPESSSREDRERCLALELPEGTHSLAALPCSAARHLADYVALARVSATQFLAALTVRDFSPNEYEAMREDIGRYEAQRGNALTRLWRYKPLRLRKATARAFAKRDFDLARFASDLGQSRENLEKELAAEEVTIDDLQKAHASTPASPRALKRAVRTVLVQSGFRLSGTGGGFVLDQGFAGSRVTLEIFFPSSAVQLAFMSSKRTGTLHPRRMSPIVEQLGLNEWDLIEESQVDAAARSLADILDRWRRRTDGGQ